MSTNSHSQQCVCCKAALSGGLDTFGDVDATMCWTCWSSCVFDGEPFDPLMWREIFNTAESWWVGQFDTPDQEQPR